MPKNACKVSGKLTTWATPAMSKEIGYTKIYRKSRKIIKVFGMRVCSTVTVGLFYVKQANDKRRSFDALHFEF